MTGTVIRTFGEAYSFKVGSLFGTDERPARPRMTGTVIRTSEVRPRMTGTVIRTFGGAESFKAGSLVRTSILLVLG